MSPVGPQQAGALTLGELAPVVNSAIALLAASGISTAQLNELQHVAFRSTDLSGAYLGLTTAVAVYLDPNADGYGWFVDAVARDHRAFGGNGPDGEAVASPSSPAWEQMDLLTVFAHELGHVLGLGDDSGDDLMGESLPSGTRRLPSSAVPAPSTGGVRVVAPTPTRAGAAVVAVDRLVRSYNLTSANRSGLLYTHPPPRDQLPPGSLVCGRVEVIIGVATAPIALAPEEDLLRFVGSSGG